MRRLTRRRVPVFLALLLLILCAGAFLFPGAVSLFTPAGPTSLATSNSAAPGSPSPTYTSLSGVLTFSPALGKAPVVEVEAIPDTHPDSPLRVTSGPGGRFAMDALTVGECYTVRVADAKRNAVSTTPVTVNATAGQAANVTLHVVGAAAVSGRVVGVQDVYHPEVLAGYDRGLIDLYYESERYLDPQPFLMEKVRGVAAAFEILEAKEESPLEGVEVSIADIDGELEARLQTDPEGNFHFDMLVPGRYEARVIPPENSLPAEYELAFTLDLEEFTHRADVVFKLLQDTLRFQCTVTDTTGAPIPNAKLQLSAQLDLALWQLPSEFEGITDAEGQFSFGPLPSDSLRDLADCLSWHDSRAWPYKLSVFAEGFPEVSVMLPNALRGQIEPAVAYVKYTSNRKAYALARENGKSWLSHFSDANTLRVDVVLKEAGSISGRVVDSTGRVVSAVRLRADTDYDSMEGLYGEVYSMGVETIADAQGNFRLTGLPKGDYFLCAYDSPLTDVPTQMKVRIESEEELDGVVVVVPAAPDLWNIRGRVIDEQTGELVQDVRTQIVSQRWDPDEGDLRVYDSKDEVPKPGTFDWIGSGSGEVMVYFRNDPEKFAEKEFSLEVAPGKVIELEIALSKPGTIRAIVTRDGEAMEDPDVCGYLAEGARGIDLCRGEFYGGKNGIFESVMLGAGVYIVEASIRTSEDRTSWVQVGKVVTLGAGGVAEVALDLSGSSRVLGSYDPDDSLAFVRELVLRQSSAGGPSGSIGRLGIVASTRISYPYHYDFAGIPSGTYRLELLTMNQVARKLELTSTLLGTVSLSEGETVEYNLGNLEDLD